MTSTTTAIYRVTTSGYDISKTRVQFLYVISVISHEVVILSSFNNRSIRIGVIVYRFPFIEIDTGNAVLPCGTYRVPETFLAQAWKEIGILLYQSISFLWKWCSYSWQEFDSTAASEYLWEYNLHCAFSPYCPRPFTPGMSELKWWNPTYKFRCCRKSFGPNSTLCFWLIQMGQI